MASLMISTENLCCNPSNIVFFSSKSIYVSLQLELAHFPFCDQYSAACKTAIGNIGNYFIRTCLFAAASVVMPD